MPSTTLSPHKEIHLFLRGQSRRVRALGESSLLTHVCRGREGRTAVRGRVAAAPVAGPVSPSPTSDAVSSRSPCSQPVQTGLGFVVDKSNWKPWRLCTKTRTVSGGPSAQSLSPPAEPGGGGVGAGGPPPGAHWASRMSGKWPRVCIRKAYRWSA